MDDLKLNPQIFEAPAIDEARRSAAPPRLETAITRIVKSYDTDIEINNLESTALPNRQAVIKAYQLIVPALYLGYYSHRALSRDNLQFGISETLYPAYDILVEQIRRAVTYAQKNQPGFASLGDQDGATWSENVVLELFEEIPKLRATLNTDALAAYNGDPSVKSLEEVVFSMPGLRATTAHRVAHVLFRAGVPMIPRIIAEYAHSETGIDIHPGADIGHSFFIDHGTGLVIGETTVIGSGVKLYQGVTLGALSVSRRVADSTRGSKRHPTIEDDVTIYSGAKILGGRTVIGAGSTIGANVWLMDSVPPGSKIMGREDMPPPSRIGS